jgi:hypothetical protein
MDLHYITDIVEAILHSTTQRLKLMLQPNYYNSNFLATASY